LHSNFCYGRKQLVLTPRGNGVSAGLDVKNEAWYEAVENAPLAWDIATVR
jgi:hypothetical protein